MPAVAGLTGLALRVRDREAALRFYRDVLGLQVEAQGNTLRLRPEGGASTLTLEVDPASPRRPARSVGLYHFALLLPARTLPRTPAPPRAPLRPLTLRPPPPRPRRAGRAPAAFARSGLAAGRRRRPRRLRGPLPPRDRKSVVEGKSVDL